MIRHKRINLELRFAVCRVEAQRGRVVYNFSLEVVTKIQITAHVPFMAEDVEGAGTKRPRFIGSP